MKPLKFSLAPWLAAAMLVGACASSPERVSTEVSRARANYVRTVDKRLDTWEKEAEHLKDRNKGGDLRANVRDTRIELRNMEAAPASEWDEYQNRVDTRLRHLETIEKGLAE